MVGTISTSLDSTLYYSDTPASGIYLSDAQVV